MNNIFLYIIFLFILIFLIVVVIFVHQRDKKRIIKIAEFFNLTPRFSLIKGWIAESKENGVTFWITRMEDPQVILYIRFSSPLPFRFYIYSDPKSFLPSLGYKSGTPIGMRRFQRQGITEGFRIFLPKDRFQEGEHILNNVSEELISFNEYVKDRMIQMDSDGLKVFTGYLDENLKDLKKVYEASLAFTRRLERIIRSLS